MERDYPKKEAPAGLGQGLGIPWARGSRPMELIVFATLDELRLWGPLPVREQLKRLVRPVLTGHAAEIVALGCHQTALSSGEG